MTGLFTNCDGFSSTVPCRTESGRLRSFLEVPSIPNGSCSLYSGQQHSDWWLVGRSEVLWNWKAGILTLAFWTTLLNTNNPVYPAVWKTVQLLDTNADNMLTLVFSSDKDPGRAVGLLPGRTDAMHRRSAQTLSQRPSACSAVSSGEVQNSKVSSLMTRNA